jgi:hypothetical protein
LKTLTGGKEDRLSQRLAILFSRSGIGGSIDAGAMFNVQSGGKAHLPETGNLRS